MESSLSLRTFPTPTHPDATNHFQIVHTAVKAHVSTSSGSAPAAAPDGDAEVDSDADGGGPEDAARILVSLLCTLAEREGDVLEDQYLLQANNGEHILQPSPLLSYL